MGDHRGEDDGIDVMGHVTVTPRHRLHQRLETGVLGFFEDTPEQLEGTGAVGVGEIDAGHVLDAGPPFGRGTPHGRHQPVVQLEDRPGQAGAVDRQVGPVLRTECTRGRQIA